MEKSIKGVSNTNTPSVADLLTGRDWIGVHQAQINIREKEKKQFPDKARESQLEIETFKALIDLQKEK